MRQKFDLHVHTSASDGSLTPRQLVERAKELSIATIAITDHDTIAGVTEAIEAGVGLGVNVIPGVEISVDYGPGTMHLCGYCFDIADKRLLDALRRVRDGRASRNPRIIEKLNALGMSIAMEEVAGEAGGDVIGRPHMASVLVKKGYVANIKEAFDKFLAKGASCYVDRMRLERGAAVDVVRNAGGVCVLAHPSALRLPSESSCRGFFIELKKAGVTGVEAFSSHHTEEENAVFVRLAGEAGLFVTGGSDYHGSSKPDVELGVFGETVSAEIGTIMAAMSRHAGRPLT